MLEKEINEQLIIAMKTGDKVKVLVLRMLNSEIKNTKIADRVKEISEDRLIGLIQKMARQHKESIEQFKLGDRQDLVEKETEELKILEVYLPEQMSSEELAVIVNKAVKETNAVSMKDMGKVMGVVTGIVKGRADGKVLSAMVKKKLM